MGRLDDCYSIDDLRLAAKRRLPRGLFEFIDKGVEDHMAPVNNRSAFTDLKLLHKGLADISNVDVGTTLFGKRSGLPLAISPTGMPGLVWHDGELALAKAAASAGIPITLATGSITPMETLAEKAGGRLWFQVIVWDDRELTLSQVRRAQAAGFEALILTVDYGISSNRSHNVKTGFKAPFRLSRRNIPDLMMHPGWVTQVILRYLLTSGVPHHVNYPDGYQASILKKKGATKVLHAMRGLNTSWDDAKRLRDAWKGPFMVKGIQRPEDAARALECGADGVIVSNHGGRVFDSAAATMDVLPAIAAEIDKKATILVDSGVRRGSDIAKALALGADAVMTGRPTLFGTAVGGQAGAEHALKLLRMEYLQTLGFIGCRSAAEIDSDALAPVPLRGRPSSAQALKNSPAY
jgi:isopentenyl diphosphate isomerase/L-lactate dehydrogenase-like FMN-dependent dehydrogenase